MAGRHHSGRRGQTVRGATGRDLRSLFEGRRVADADLRGAVYVRPHGLRFHVVRNVCNGQGYVVADASGHTYSPGQSVLLGSRSGAAGEVVISRPPAGMVGSSGYSLSPISTRAGYVTPETALPDALVLSVDYSAATMRLSEYSAGAWVLDRAVGVTSSTIATSAEWLHIADGRYAIGYDSSPGIVAIWDSESDTYSSHTVAPGTFGTCIWPIGGGVTWVEIGGGIDPPYIMTATRYEDDYLLASPSAVQTATHVSPVGTSWEPGLPALGCRTATGWIVGGVWSSPSDAEAVMGVRMGAVAEIYADDARWGLGGAPDAVVSRVAASGDLRDGLVRSYAEGIVPMVRDDAARPSVAELDAFSAVPISGGLVGAPMFYGSANVLLNIVSGGVVLARHDMPAPWLGTYTQQPPGGTHGIVLYVPL